MKKYYNIILLSTMLTLVLLWGIFTLFLPEYWNTIFLVVPLFFLSIEIIFCKLLHRFVHIKQKLNWYILYKFAKSTLCIAFVALYVFGTNVPVITFLLTFGVLYMISLFVETWIFLDYQKKDK